MHLAPRNSPRLLGGAPQYPESAQDYLHRPIRVHCLELGRFENPGILTYFLAEKCSNAWNFLLRHPLMEIRTPTYSARLELSFGAKILFRRQVLPLHRGSQTRMVPPQKWTLLRSWILVETSNRDISKTTGSTAYNWYTVVGLIDGFDLD